MVLIEIKNVKLIRGNDWALVQYCIPSQGSEGWCGGKFGCEANTLVPGQIFNGKFTTKRDRDGHEKVSFDGKPDSRRNHMFKHALKSEGINFTDRTALFSAFRNVSELFSALDHHKSSEIMSIQKVGRKKLERIYAAYASIASDLCALHTLSKTFPSLMKYLSKTQRTSLLKWFKDDVKEVVRKLRNDPFRILHDDEYDYFPYLNERRMDFLKETRPKSRTKMVSAAVADLHLTYESDPRAKRANAIHKMREYMKKHGSYWMPLHIFLANVGNIEADWPFVIHDNHIALVKFSEIEKHIGKKLRAIHSAAAPVFFEVDTDGECALDEVQRSAVIGACTSPIFILNGGAGTGKTTVCAEIVKCLNDDVLCAAPTGKAAQRLAEVTGGPAFTIHRLVYMKNLVGNDGAPLSRNLLLDEQSMQDPEILGRLLSRVSFNKIIFVGDTAQLTSVSPGQLFKDLCNSSYPKVELTNIYRSSETSFISSNGQKIRNGDVNLDCSADSFEVHPYTSAEQIIAHAKSIYEQTGTMPMVLCNTNAEVAKLNPELREICNPIGAKSQSSSIDLDYFGPKSYRYPKWRFGPGDSVINTVNKYHTVNVSVDGHQGYTKNELQVSNGEVGTVLSVAGPIVTVRFKEIVHYDLRVKEEVTIRPAYALTVNKSQGSEYPIVIIKSSSSWGDKRERFYTAVTRAKQKCIVYEVRSSNSDCIRAPPATRKTYLFQRY